MTENRHFHDRQARGWQERLLAACMPQLVQAIRYEAGADYRALIRDLETPLLPEFEREVARHLGCGDERELIPAETLMPAMLQGFGLTADQFGPEEKEHLMELRNRCNRCLAVGHCWKALRARAGREAYRDYCPNAPAFEEKAREFGS
jgi:hypothetical protein